MVKKRTPLVNGDSFQETANALLMPTSHQDLADALDCSVASLRAALRDPKSPAFRKAPAGWEVTMRRLLQAKADHFAILSQRLTVKGQDR